MNGDVDYYCRLIVENEINCLALGIPEELKCILFQRLMSTINILPPQLEDIYKKAHASIRADPSPKPRPPKQVRT